MRRNIEAGHSYLGEYERIRKRIMSELRKRLESAIDRASKKNCWYDQWNRRGDRAEYGILYEPVDAFLKEANVEEILPMVELLLEKAKRQIEHSNDDGDCAAQARYWAHKMVKAAVKKNCSHITLIDWALKMGPKDIYFLSDAETIVLDKNNVTSSEVWSEIAEHYKGVNRRVYLFALKKAGNNEERRKSMRETAIRRKNYVFLVEDALLRGDRAEAREICERGISQNGAEKDMLISLRNKLAHLDVAEGRYEREFELRVECFEREQSVSSYESLMELSIAMDKHEQTRATAIQKLESSKNWYVLSRIALKEGYLMDAAGYYWRFEQKSSGSRYGYEPYKFDFDLADRLSRVYPAEAVKILAHIVDKGLQGYTPEYKCVNQALASIKQLFFVLGMPKEWEDMLKSLRSAHPRKKTLREMIDVLES